MNTGDMRHSKINDRCGANAMQVAIILVFALSPGCQKQPGLHEGVLTMKPSIQIVSEENISAQERVTAARDKLKEDIEQRGLSRVSEDLAEMAQPSIRLKATRVTEDKITTGSSKLGGTPDLPEGMAWPECNGVPMALLAQVNLKEVALYDLDGQLPQSGILYFFYEVANQAWGFDPKDRGNWKVIYYDGDLATLRAATFPKDLNEACQFPPCDVAFSNELTLPTWDSEEVSNLRLSEVEADKYIELLEAMHGDNETIFRMFGFADEIQGDMKLECQLASNGLYVGDSSGYNDPRRPALEPGAKDWRLLLQIDSEEDTLGMMWGDCGRVYFWIREGDLENRNLDDVWLVLQCY